MSEIGQVGIVAGQAVGGPVRQAVADQDQFHSSTLVVPSPFESGVAESAWPPGSRAATTVGKDHEGRRNPHEHGANYRHRPPVVERSDSTVTTPMKALIEHLRMHALRTDGPFILRSGAASDWYLDARQTTYSGEGAWLVGERS